MTQIKSKQDFSAGPLAGLRVLEHGARDGTLAKPEALVARIVGEFAQVRAALQASLPADA